LHDVPISREEHQFLDLAREELPIDPAAMAIEFDGDPAAGVAIDADPDLAIGAGPQMPLDLVTGNLAGRSGSLEAEVLGSPLVVVRLKLGRFRAHGLWAAASGPSVRRLALAPSTRHPCFEHDSGALAARTSG